MVDRLAAVIQRAQTPTRRRRRPSKRHLRSRKYDERLTSAPTSTARQRRSALLLALVISLLLAACTGGGVEPEQTAQQTYEEAKAQVPIHGDERKPLTWRVDPFPNPDTAAAAEAAQHYFIVFDVLGSAQRPVDANYFELLSHFTTDEWLRRIQRWFPTADWSPPPHHFGSPAHAERFSTCVQVSGVAHDRAGGS